MSKVPFSQGHWVKVTGSKMRVVVALLLLVSILAGGMTSAWAEGWQGKVIRVIDGDSLSIRGPKGVETIRLYGVDAPEYGQPYFQLAKAFVKKRLAGKRVWVKGVDQDRYGRLVAIVSLGSKRPVVINQALVAAGLAWVYRKYCNQGVFCQGLLAAEQQARQQKKGLWQAANPMSPWQWKWQKHH